MADKDPNRIKSDTGKPVTRQQRHAVVKMLAEGHDRETIATQLGLTPGQVSAVAAHVTIAEFSVVTACNSDWIFIPAPAAADNQSVAQPLILEGSCQPASILFDPISANVANQDFEAVVIGDCTLSWSGDGSPAPALGGP